MICVSIDTIGEKTILKILREDGAIVDSFESLDNRNQSEKLLQELDGLIAKNSFRKKDISKIIVNTLPGSYTGSRVGVTIANFLALALNIPVISQGDNVQTGETFDGGVSPKYLRDPHITRSKSGL